MACMGYGPWVYTILYYIRDITHNHIDDAIKKYIYFLSGYIQTRRLNQDIRTWNERTSRTSAIAYHCDMHAIAYSFHELWNYAPVLCVYFEIIYSTERTNQMNETNERQYRVPSTHIEFSIRYSYYYLYSLGFFFSFFFFVVVIHLWLPFILLRIPFGSFICSIRICLVVPLRFSNQLLFEHLFLWTLECCVALLSE